MESFYLGNLDAQRDFIFVSDTVDDFLHAAQTRGIEGKTSNLGVGSEIRIADLAVEILSLLDMQKEI